MRNKIISILLIATMTISLSACGGTENSNNNREVEKLEEQIEKLEEQIAELKSQNAELQKQIGESTQEKIGNNNTSSALESINESTAETWGVCGENLTWYYQNNILVIRGTGDMANWSTVFYDYENIPWYDFRDKIHWVYIEDGVTSIGSYAFRDCGFLSKVEIPKSVTSIGDGAFYMCDSLSSVIISDNITYIGGSAYYNCSLEEVIFNNPNADLKIAFAAFEHGTKIIINGNEYSWGNYEKTENGFYIGGIQLDSSDEVFSAEGSVSVGEDD